ncbi:hypothetical protein ABH926_009258 [Catenulispora sp. GP43]|uniref:hypothetical protein n=1 Tax=Catenulispora sp. GP43 TaxID=3156263 RepID=UPI00351232FF
MSGVRGVRAMSGVGGVGARGARWCGVLCVAVALAAGLSGCRPRAVANQNMPTIPPSAAATSSGPATTSGTGQLGQQDIDSLNGIIASVGGAVTSVRSALGGDSPTANG